MKKLLYILPFILGGCFFIIATFSDSYVDSNGYLHEPFFFMIPLGYLFIIIGALVLFIRATVIFIKKRNIV